MVDIQVIRFGVDHLLYSSCLEHWHVHALELRFSAHLPLFRSTDASLLSSEAYEYTTLYNNLNYTELRPNQSCTVSVTSTVQLRNIFQEWRPLPQVNNTREHKWGVTSTSYNRNVVVESRAWLASPPQRVHLNDRVFPLGSRMIFTGVWGNHPFYFEKVRVFKSSLCSNTLTWDNKLGPLVQTREFLKPLERLIWRVGGISIQLSLVLASSTVEEPILAARKAGFSSALIGISLQNVNPHYVFN